MTEDIVFGSGVAQYSYAQLQVELADRHASDRTGIEKCPIRVDLSARLRQNHEWSVRHQHARGTCNAFAVVAAEELRRFIKSGESIYQPLSEEHLYDTAWRQPFTHVPEPPTGLAEKIFKQRGGTYLGQVMDVLTDVGLADAADAPYEPHAPVQPPEHPKKFNGLDLQKVAARKVDKTVLVHDIAQKTDDGIGPWKNGSKRVNLADFFVRCLAAGTPVVAAFAILNEAEYVWTGEYARISGHIRYPTDDIFQQKRPVAGHSVCLVGYVKNCDDDPNNPYTFLFRNSYGTDIFAKHADQFPERLNAGLAGYGIISARDVVQYCWEFLAYAPPEET